MGYDEDLAAYNEALAQWEADKAAYDAAMIDYAEEMTAYQAALDQFAIDQAAYDAAVAANAQYPDDLEHGHDSLSATFNVALVDMADIVLRPDWAGPWGYSGELSKWMNGPLATMPPAVTDPHKWVRDRLVKAGIETDEWDAHVQTCLGYEWLKKNPPAAIPPQPETPVPPTQPVSPGAPPVPPIPPETSTATFKATPTGYTVVATGVTKASSNPILDLWNVAHSGDVIELDGSFRRADLKAVSARPQGSPRVIFRAPAGMRSQVTPTPVVGGSDTLQLMHNVSDSQWEDLDFYAASRAGLKTVSSKKADGTYYGTGQNHTFKRCSVLGGWNPTVPNAPPTDTLWGFHAYFGGNFLFEDCLFQGICKEHVGMYGHNNQGDYVFRRCAFRWGGRTASQFMARSTEGPLAKGNITFEDCYVEDVCLEDGGGGSALTFRGGAPDTVAKLTRTKVRLGCNPALQYPHNKNITGAVLVDSGQYAFPGGTKEMWIDGCDFEVGTVYPGVSNARRANVSVADCGLLVIRNSRIAQGPQANPIAIEIANSVGSVRFEGANVVVGQIKYQGVQYTLAALQSAHPELFFP